MFFPDNFTGLTALSERVHRFVLRWAHRHRVKAVDRRNTCRDPAAPVGSQRCGTEAAASSMEYRARMEAGLDHWTGEDLLVATSAHAPRRRRIVRSWLRALNERREAASTKAVTTASTPGLPLQSSRSSLPTAINGRARGLDEFAAVLLRGRDEHAARAEPRLASRGLQDRGAFASPGESDSFAVLAGALAGYPKSSIPLTSKLTNQAPAQPLEPGARPLQGWRERSPGWPAGR